MGNLLPGKRVSGCWRVGKVFRTGKMSVLALNIEDHFFDAPLYPDLPRNETTGQHVIPHAELSAVGGQAPRRPGANARRRKRTSHCYEPAQFLNGLSG